MFSIIYSLFPLLLLPISIILTVKRKSLSWEIKKGKICYNCKEDLNLSNEELMKILMLDTDNSKLCLCCSRDLKINSIKNPLIASKYKFKKYLISKNSDKLVWYFGGSVFFFIVIDFSMMIFFDVKLHLFWIYSSINIIFWIINIYKTYYTTIKKPSDLI